MVFTQDNKVSKFLKTYKQKQNRTMPIKQDPDIIDKQIKSVFGALWEEEKPSDFSRLVPYIILIVQVLAIIIMLIKK